ncbi:DUF3299 domain-containing protein [Ruegeria sp. HKCCSP351]|uniref:DUF3299 domain-containing protein n=1 Tax=Ruegeria sp. HKCCSP351 TaxID=2794832 RepID=UPI001AE49CBA|nr:DUF3299 domain-containing protein [Ruegeria sp. HKCCSP351]
MQTLAAKLRTRLLRSLIAVFLTATGAFAEQVAISFRELPDPVALQFDDPFRDMGFEMMGELRTFVRLEQRLANGEVPEEARPRLEARLETARGALRLAGHDIEGLLAQRWVVAKARKRAFFSTNPNLHQATVTITGFLIPAGTNEDGFTVGYLVPEVGMCSHMPPPPPNQLIRVTFDAGSPARSLYTPVTVTGLLAPQESNETIFVLDGEARMASMWNLEATQVTLAVNTPRTPLRTASQIRNVSHSTPTGEDQQTGNN